MSGRLEAAMRSRIDGGGKCLVPYITGGYPGWMDAVRACAANGADAIEIGIPFSDPVMDGPIIQQASQTEFALPDVVQPGSVDPVTDSVTWSAPVTKTADFTVADDETNLINNKSGSTCTVTLPAAASYSGRPLVFQNYHAQTLVSASSNVVPIGGGSAGTAILAAVAGNWAMLISDGTNWVVMSQAPNNILLLE